MSKKSKRQSMLKEQVAQQRAETRKPPIKAKKVSKTAASRRAGAYPAASQTASGKFSRASQVARSLAPSNLLRIRISAIALAVIALAGGIAWGLTSRGAYTPLTVVGMVLLGLVAGFCLLVAFRTEDMVRRARMVARR